MFFKNLIFSPRFTKGITRRIVSKNNTNLISRKYSNSTGVFDGIRDIYNGMTVDTSKFDCDATTFTNRLMESLRQWKADGRRCVWFQINIKQAEFVPILAKHGFNYHHARNDFVVMFKWLPKDSKHGLPPSCHTNIGVGGLVLNDKMEILTVTEKHYDHPHLKFPGGYVEPNEDIIDAAIREVREETGVPCVFQSIVTFRHAHGMMFGNSDIYILVMLKSLSDIITISSREVLDCSWMPAEEFLQHPHTHEFNRLVLKKAFEYRKKNIAIGLEKITVKFSRYTREMCYLAVVDNYEYK